MPKSCILTSDNTGRHQAVTNFLYLFTSVVEAVVIWGLLTNFWLTPKFAEMGSGPLVTELVFFYPLHGQTISASEGRKLRHSRRWVEST